MIYSFQDIQTTLMDIQSHPGSASDFELLIPDVMNDSAGMTIAAVEEAIVARGWRPDGFDQHSGYRVYKYANLDIGGPDAA